MHTKAAALLIASIGLPLAAPAPAQAERTSQPQYTTVMAPDGVPLAVMEWGNPEGPPVLLLHGFSLSSAVWRRQQDPALSARYRMVAFDLRAHGASGKPAAAEAYVDSKRWADDVAAVMKATELERPVVVAWSFGGNVVMNYVRHYGDDHLAGIVFVGSTGGMAERLHPLSADAAYREADRQRRSAALADNIVGQRAFVRMMTAQPLPDEDAELWLISTLQLPRYARAAMAGMPLENPDLIDRITVPTLFVTGAEDLSVPVSQLQPLAQRLPRSAVSVYEGAGHAAFAEQPQRFNRELTTFAESARTRPPAVSQREAVAIGLVRSYLQAHNRHDVEAALGSWVEPIDLRTRTRPDEVVVSFSHVLEQSDIADAIGLPLVVADAASEGFLVRRERLVKVEQPAFAAACARVLGAGFGGVADWLGRQDDPRRAKMLKSDGSIELTAATARLWIDTILEWRSATG